VTLPRAGADPVGPGRRLVPVEDRGADLDVPIRTAPRMTRRQVCREAEPRGFTFADVPRIHRPAPAYEAPRH
jgi:hypothetical protein